MSFKNLVLKNYYFVSFALSVLSVLAVIILKDILPPIVPLLYGTATGPNQLVPTFGLLIAPGVSILITITNARFQ